MGFRRKKGPAPYTGVWYLYDFMTIESPGEMFLGLFDDQISTKGGIYRTGNHGDSWTQVLSHADFGGVNHTPMHLIKTSAGYLVVVFHNVAPRAYMQLYQAASLAGPWTVVLGGVGTAGIYRGVPNLWKISSSEIWLTGAGLLAGGNNKVIHYSLNGGLTWSSILLIASFFGTNPAQIRVNPAGTRGFMGDVTTSADTQDRYSATPKTGGWTAVGVVERARRFGVNWPNIVVPYATVYYFSADNGVTFPTSRAVPTGMQTTGTQAYDTGVDMSPLDADFLLAAINTTLNSSMWVSYDQGVNWTQKIAALGSDGSKSRLLNSVMADVYNVNKAYAWGTGGFFRSDDKGATWQARSRGLELGQS